MTTVTIDDQERERRKNEVNVIFRHCRIGKVRPRVSKLTGQPIMPTMPLIIPWSYTPYKQGRCGVWFMPLFPASSSDVSIVPSHGVMM